MLRKNGAVAYLDGIRGIAAFLVFLNHFALVFYSAYFSQKAETSHLNGYEIEYSHSLYSFITNGGFCVAIFFVLSGYVLSRKYFRTNDLEIAISGLHRRFIRLYIPIAFTLILSYVLMTSNNIFNDPVSRITLSDWFIKQWRMAEPAQRLWNSLSYGTMFAGDASFDTCLWTMSYEFYGSLFVFSFLVFTHFTKRYRLMMMLLSMLYFYMAKSPFYLAFVLGMTLNYTEQWIENKKGILTTAVAVTLLIVSLMFGSVPFCSPLPDTWQENFKDVVWDYTPWCLTIGAYLLVLAYIISDPLKKMVSFLPFRFLGYISFSLYLIHPLILGSFTSKIFLNIYDGKNYNHAVLVAFISTIVFLLPVSWIMARFVDQFGINLAKKVYDKMKGPIGDIVRSSSGEAHVVVAEAPKPAVAPVTAKKKK